MADEGGTDPDLLDGCFAVMAEVARDPRDEEALHDAVAEVGNRWGVYSNILLAYISIRLGRTVVIADPSVSDLDQLLTEIALAEEIDLGDHGEA